MKIIFGDDLFLNSNGKKLIYGKLTLHPFCDPDNWMVAWFFCFPCRKHYPRLTRNCSYCDIDQGDPGKKALKNAEVLLPNWS